MAHASGKVLGLGLIIALTGCRSIDTETAWREPRPLGTDIVAFKVPSQAALTSAEAIKLKEPTGGVTFSQALRLALMQNPELASVSYEVSAAESRQAQARFLPNPEAAVEVEEFGTDGFGKNGFDTAKSSIVFSQMLELGGKRGKRSKAASLDSQLAGWDYETKRLDVLTECRQAFIEVLAVQERLTLAESFTKLGREVYDTVSARVKAGKVSPLEETKARVTLENTKIGLSRVRRELHLSRKNLAATWGSTSLSFSEAKGNLEAIPAEIPAVDQLLHHILRDPELARWGTELELRKTAIQQEQAARIPDLTANAGVERFEESGDYALKFGFSMALPVFDQNRGSISAARFELSKAKAEQRAAEVRIKTKLSEAHQELSSSHLEAVALRKQVLPAAGHAFDAAREGYQRGKFGYLDVLDAQRTWFEVRGQYIDALAAYHQAVVRIERLIGRALYEKADMKE